MHRVVDERGHTVATVAFPPGSRVGDGLAAQERNARLIAVAPEMLELLGSLCDVDPLTAVAWAELRDRAISLIGRLKP